MTTTGTRRRPRRAVVGTLVLLLGVLAGCAAPGGGAGAHNAVGRCATVLQRARAAVPGGGAPVLIRPVSGPDIAALSRQAGAPLTDRGPAPKPATPPSPSQDAQGEREPKYCLVVIPGRFAANTVPGAVPVNTAGDHVLVVARTRPAGIERLLVTTGVPAAATPPPWWKFWA